MTGDRIDLPKTPQPGIDQANQADEAAPSQNMPNLKQRTTSTPSSASLGAFPNIKTLKDDIDPDDVDPERDDALQDDESDPHDVKQSKDRLRTLRTKLRQRQNDRRFVRNPGGASTSQQAGRIKQPAADVALHELEDLCAEVLDDPAASMDEGQQARLDRDLQTLRALITAGKEQGWLPEDEEPGDKSTEDEASQDPESRTFMENKVRRFVKAITDHLQHLRKKSGGADDASQEKELDQSRAEHAKDAKAYLTALSQAGTLPKSASFVMEQQEIANAFIDAHHTRGAEIMDSLPPDYLAKLVRRGTKTSRLIEKLEICGELLHLPDEGLSENVWKGMRSGGGRSLTSWQAALVRRTVAMLALACASKPEIETARDKLIAKMQKANGRIAPDKQQDVELPAEPHPLNSLATYTGKLEQTAADENSAEQQRWQPLVNLHTAMHNVLTVLEAGATTDDALTVMHHDLDFAGDVLPHIGEPPRGLFGPALIDDEQLDEVDEHPYAHLVKEMFADENADAGQISGTRT